MTPWLTMLVLLPLAGGVATLLMRRGQEGGARTVALGASLITLAVSLVVWMRFDPASAD